MPGTVLNLPEYLSDFSKKTTEESTVQRRHCLSQGHTTKKRTSWASKLSLPIAFCPWVTEQPPVSKFLSLGGGILYVLRGGSYKNPISA